MSFFPTGVLTLSIAVLSAYALSRSLASISNIKIYEEKAEKAADWSNAAKARLWDTRYTIGAGFVCCIASLVSGLFYLVFGRSAIWPAVLAVSLIGTARYMQNFWSSKSQVPMLDQYNAAIKQSMDFITLLDMLSAGWGLVALLRMFGL
ncbi:unnamed protein product [Discula destructiva]